MTLTDAMLREMPMWHLDRMTLPRGKFSPEEQRLAKQEIKRRFGLPEIKIPPPPPPIDPDLKLTAIPGGGWIWTKETDHG